MQIILLEKVVNLGNLGDVVNVKEGYARNFLIPSGRAKRANKINLAEFEARRVELEKVAAEKLVAAQAAATKVEGLTVQLVRKAGVDGRLFGSVSTGDIAEALVALGHKIEKAGVRLPNGAIKLVGDHPVEVALHTDVVVAVTVSVLGEH
ncbi:50S ribosomal protein L9 [Uliginosibacterium flavum]|uniref:Large ribosomal subunit protein bL9 n=1 Tax=Uliginosibacterium flavum TaxID=1396831 RepID=A0ABV2TQE4_9RHOO